MPNDFQQQVEEEYASFGFAADGIGMIASHRGDGTKPVPSRVVGNPLTAPPETRAIEARADVESLDALHQERRRIVDQIARLKALHGPFGKWDAKRKQMLEAIKVRVRMDIKQRGDKPTDAMVDAEAHADEMYGQLIDRGIEDAAEYVRLDVELSEVEERIRNRETCLLVYNSELKMAR